MPVASVQPVVTGIIPQIADYAGDLTSWRQHLHAHPELDLACHATADFVVARLKEFGITMIHRGLAETGVIALIDGQGDGPTIGLRADMDALPIHEETSAAWISKRPGVMHACGHDGHTTMLLGAARYLAAHRNFRGRVALIFQPGEELSGGGRIMVEAGVFDRFAISEVYALHTLPGKALGSFHTRSGPFLASVDDFRFDVQGQGGHVGYPDLCRNPITQLAPLIKGVSKIESELSTKHGPGVVACTVAQAGEATNVVPDSAMLTGSVRTQSAAFRVEAEARLSQLAETTDMPCRFQYAKYYPPLVNHMAQTTFAAKVAATLADVDADSAPHNVAEDFSYMLETCPGCFLFIGQGPGPSLHSATFDFDDSIAAIGASFFARLVEARSRPNWTERAYLGVVKNNSGT
ncbi:amidohydrolase [Yoonia sp. BS5-3]|uniref:Amidohydrolase n=1 Tax=Yoonia phaeophyticola TaxID=3137369 RepID=A0ABZ2V4I8_9RHOB